MARLYAWIFLSMAWLDVSFLSNTPYKNMKGHYSGKCFILMPKCPLAKPSFIQGVSRWPLKLKNDVTHQGTTVKRTAHLNFRRRQNSDEPVNDGQRYCPRSIRQAICMSPVCAPWPLCTTIALLCLFLSHASMFWILILQRLSTLLTMSQLVKKIVMNIYFLIKLSGHWFHLLSTVFGF